NKDELMMSVLEKVSGDIEQFLAEDMRSIEDPIKKLEIFVNVCCEVVRSTKEYYQVSMDFWTQINQKDAVREIISKHYQKIRETCALVIKEGIESGKFRKVDPNEYASYVIAVIDGISLQWLFDDSIFSYDNLVKMSAGL